jgi:hypothetical protein
MVNSGRDSVAGTNGLKAGLTGAAVAMWLTLRVKAVLEQYHSHCDPAQVVPYGFPLEKTTQAPFALLYSHCDTAQLAWMGVYQREGLWRCLHIRAGE